MTPVLLTLFGALTTVGALLAVLLPVMARQGAALRREIDAQGTALRREIDTLRTDVTTDVAAVRVDVAEVRRDLHALAERVARIEGTLSGPWRPPANGTPAPAAGAPPETAP